MYQTTLFDQLYIPHSPNSPKLTNVASVPQLSPFRYPGGKTWLIPRIRHWLAPAIREAHGIRPVRPVEYIEPFAGGGIAALTVASERLAEHVTMVELDADVAAVWQTALDPDGADWLAQAIMTFDLTPESVHALLAQPAHATRDRALRTIVRNRVNRGGILAPGSGILKQGENGRGIRSRWYPATLAKRIRAIARLRDRITFIHGDGLAVMRAFAQSADAVFFLDPPYSVPGKGKRAGSRLYTHSQLDHAALFALAAHLRGDVLLTYDRSDEAQALAQRHGLSAQPIAMKNTHHATMDELLIGRNLDWARMTGA